MSNVSSDIINNQRQSVETMLSNTNSEISNMTTSVTDVLGNLTKELENSLASLHTKVQEHNVQSLQQMVDLRTTYQELSLIHI